jgi:hypothetical protein
MKRCCYGWPGLCAWLLVIMTHDSTGRSHAYLASPVPEPSTFLLGGLGGLGLWIGRRLHHRRVAMLSGPPR